MFQRNHPVFKVKLRSSRRFSRRPDRWRTIPPVRGRAARRAEIGPESRVPLGLDKYLLKSMFNMYIGLSYIVFVNLGFTNKKFFKLATHGLTLVYSVNHG
jgi:hypothetical protein